MQREIEINSKESLDDLKSRLNTLTGKPKIIFCGFNSSKKKYSGEINETEFWFSWTEQLKVIMYGNPVVKGKLKKLSNGTNIQIRVKESSIYAISAFAFILLLALAAFSIKSFNEIDIMSFKMIVLFILLTIGLIVLNMWKVKRGMNKMTEELKDIFDDIKINNCF